MNLNLNPVSPAEIDEIREDVKKFWPNAGRFEVMMRAQYFAQSLAADRASLREVLGIPADGGPNEPA